MWAELLPSQRIPLFIKISRGGRGGGGGVGLMGKLPNARKTSEGGGGGSFPIQKISCSFSVKKKGGVAAPWKISLQKAQNSFPNHLFRHQISKYRMIMILLTGWCTKTPFSPFDPVQLRKLYQVDSSLTIPQYRILTPICNTILLIVSYWSTNIKLT